jgi:hypothetical protein
VSASRKVSGSEGGRVSDPLLPASSRSSRKEQTEDGSDSRPRPGPPGYLTKFTAGTPELRGGMGVPPMSGKAQKPGEGESASTARHGRSWLAAAALTAFGFALGWLMAPSSPSGPAAHSQTLAASPPRLAEARVKPLDRILTEESVADPIPVWEKRWQALIEAPGSARRDEMLAALLEERAQRDAAGALALASTEPNRLRREKLRQAALRGWAARSPDSAADWVQANLSESDRDAAMTAVIVGAAAAPDIAKQLVQRLARADPTQAYAYGHTLIRAWVDRGEFWSAAQFATSGDPEASSRAEFSHLAFAGWAQHQPTLAAQAALALADPESRQTALTGVIAGWAPAEPAGLAEFSLQLPTGSERTAALAESLRHWVMQDPVAASAWINRLESSAEIDAGAAAVATLQPLIANRPDVAVGWAESIVEPALRRQTLGAVLQIWSLSDPAGAQRYLKAHPGAVEQMAAK